MNGEEENERAMRRLETLEKAREKADWQRRRKIEGTDWFERLNRSSDDKGHVGT